MRLASFLPMLLLAFSVPIAAQNCNISDLTAKVVQVNPLDCTFFVTLDFQHDGPGDLYTVSGNGTNYGVFPYSQLPIILGPFTGNPNNPTVLEFTVQDMVFPDCHAVVLVDFPPCGNGGVCDITDFNVLPGPCDPSGLTYSLLVNFQVQILGNATFEVWANGTSIGHFPLANLPLLIPAFPASGNPKDVIKICIDGQPDCCETLEFAAPDCANPPCGISNLKVETGDCLSDSTYKVTINFDALVPLVSDSFALRANNHFIGMFGVNQLPLMRVIKWDGGLHDEIKVCILSIGNVTCCLTKEYLVPTCLPVIPCGIHDLVVKSDTCTSDSTFLAILNFGVNDPSAVDSFDLWANGEFWGHYGMNQLPLHITDFPWNGLIFNHIKVCTGNVPACCKEYQFLAPACLPYGPCELTDILLQTGPCTSDSTYKITLNFNGTNPGNGTFTVSIHNQLIDTFNLAQLPLMLEVPWNGQMGDFIQVCILGTNGAPGTNGCCRIKQFIVPGCLLPCNIFDVTLDPGACNPNSNTYNLHLDFEVNNPGNGFFEVWGNNTYLGLFPLASLPIVIPNFPSNGNAGDVIKICINDNPDCCKTLDFQGPDCGGPCEIFDVSLDPGACHPNEGTYDLHLNFAVQNPGNAFFEVWGNGTYLGSFPLSGLPMVIPNFPSNGAASDIIKICINDHPDCCKIIEFQGPDCDGGACEIFDVSVDPGDCIPGTNGYNLHLNFGVHNPGNALFEVWGNGTYLGAFPLAGLPMIIPNFPSNGNAMDIIKICINDHPDCCQIIEFQGPDCDGPCEIFDLTVETGDCHPADSTYNVTVNFQVQNPGSNTFSLWANGQLFGTYNLNQLPLHLNNFPWDGTGPNDLIKVCITGSNGSLSCCRTIEFPTPDCFNSGNCDVYDLHVDVGGCTSNTTYEIVVNFQVANPPSNVFSLWANGVFFGIFDVNQLPLHINDFPWDGGAKDFLKVCFTNNPSGQGACCAEIEYNVPDCLNNGGDCHITDLVATAGDCNPNEPTYPLTINFNVSSPGNDFFEVWVNNVYFGAHLISSLPFTIPNAPSNGNAGDIIKVCINDHPDCCQTIEIQGPNCPGNGICEIFDVVLDPGDCIPGTNGYNLHLNFQVVNPGNAFFEVWGNGTYLGSFPLAGLPMVIPNFPSNGAAMDIIKICINDHPDCCKIVEFQGPNCGSNDDCHIFDLVVLHTPCLCGQFFAVLSFQYSGGVSGSFDISGNGNNYGNYPYNTPQPIILGPLDGDGITNYNFVVKDHEHPDLCHDEFNVGKIECMDPVHSPNQGTSTLTLSPNPTANWLNVTALLENGAAMGQANVEVYAADGRLAQTNTVANGANFQLDVSNLPSGVYRLVLKSDSGRLEGTFAKQ